MIHLFGADWSPRSDSLNLLIMKCVTYLDTRYSQYIYRLGNRATKKDDYKSSRFRTRYIPVGILDSIFL